MIPSIISSFRMISRTHLPATHVRWAATQTSSLAKLRKATGYSVAKCKKALELHTGDIEKAEQWLHAEAQKGGWSKIGNLQSHSTTQGLIGVCIQNTSAAMVEVNCQSDFVARNAEFQSFVSKVLSACISHAVNQNFNQDFTKMNLSAEELNALKFENSSLADLSALATGKFGEKTVLKRATFIRTKGDIMLSSFAHPSKEFPDLPGGVMGKFAALLAYQQKISAPHHVAPQILLDFGHQLCQHIVGMNPQSLGEFTAEDIGALQKKRQDDVAKPDVKEKDNLSDEKISTAEEEDQTAEEEESRDELEKTKVDANESRLLHQTFLLDPSKVVGETMMALSVEIIDFERFECGENVNN